MNASVVLAVNTGSSSLKVAVFTGDDAKPVATAAVEGIGSSGNVTAVKGDVRRERAAPAGDHAAALETALALLNEIGAPAPNLVGHRVVHGGPKHFKPTVIDPSLLSDLEALVPIAPLHLPPAIAGIKAVTKHLPDVKQIACFDTAFHADMPEVARHLPLPARVLEGGVRRYGFHGLSFEYIMSTLASPPPARVVIAHLGSGSSLVAVRDGKSIDTTMGFTPTGGILMGTRTGDLDPGVLIYLQRERKLDADALEALVAREGGLKGIAGESDMKKLLAREDAEAKLAVAMYGYGIRKAIAALTAALGGLDLLVFTGGIGEHAPAVRASACEGLAGFGIRVDAARNAKSEDVISPDDAAVRVRVIPTDEDRVVARHALEVDRAGR